MYPEALHLAFVIALAGAAEPVLEQVVGLQLGEGAGALTPAVPQYLRHRQPGVVVENALGHSAQEGDGGNVAVQEGLGGLGGIGLDEAAVAVGQVDDETVGLPLHPANDHHGLAEVALGVAWRMGQRHEHLPGLAAMLSDVVLDRSVSAVEPVLVPEALEDALGGVALLPGTREVILQDPVDDSGERLKLGPSRRSLSPVARRNGVGQHLAHGVPVQPELSGDLPNTLALHHHRPANPQIYVHLVQSVAPSISSTSSL